MFNPFGDFNPIHDGAAYFPLVAGLEAYSPRLRISLDLRQSYMTSLSARDTNFDVIYLRKISSIGLTYHFKGNNENRRPVRVGIGFNLIKTNSKFEALLGVSPYMKGGTVFIGLPLKWLDVELRAEPDEEDVLSADKFSMAFIYRFGRKEDRQKYRNGNNELNFLIGIHTSLNRNYYNPNKGNDIYSAVMLLPEFGLEYLFTRYNIAMQARRNVWIGFTAGDPHYDINGYTEQIHLGAARVKKIKRKYFRYGIYYVLMRDMGQSTAPVAGAVEYYPEKGVAFNISWPVRKIEIEARAMYAYHISQYITSLVVNAFDRYRVSLGAVYRVDPLRKKE